MLTFGSSNGPRSMDWSAGEGENSPTSSSPSSGIRRESQHYQDLDSFSEEDDLSDDFSLLDSDEERRSTDIRVSQHLIQVSAIKLGNLK